MNIRDKHSLINIYQKGAYKLRGLVSTAPLEALDFKPDQTAWSVREHVAHMLDSELFAYLRYRKSIAEPGEDVDIYNEKLWQQNLDYTKLDVHSSLMLIETIRTMTATHLMEIVDTDWEEYYVNHPERGNNNLIDLLNAFIDHVEQHYQYIERNLAQFGH